MSTKKGGGGQQKLTRGDFKEKKIGKLSEKSLQGRGAVKNCPNNMTSFVNAPLVGFA